ncbi:sensor histidine kinase [Ruegeria arenilitoris]|uniref:sensor histidine kinase n=1 Tax=Ruegeria arenilitoris TaxID=1173585 RepID=UPI0014801515|nr:sensor histidine kinase [Ruegeria arenilitoris]
MRTKVAELTIGNWSLSRVFLAASILVMGSATAIVGVWVSNRIQNAVVQNSANSAALYMESIVSPLSQELALGDRLSEQARRALDEIFMTQPMRDRIVSYKFWKQGGVVVHASDTSIIGNRFEPTGDLQRAWIGEISGSFEELDHDESAAEAALGIPLLEVYSPIRELWSGEIIAVAEFYERADQLEMDLAKARRTSWLVVGSAFLASTVVLFCIVAIGDNTIRRQARLLKKRLAESERMAAQNAMLRSRVVEASGRYATQTDRFLKKLGAELHDGPAQYLSLAALRLEAAFSDRSPKPKEAEEIQQSLQKSLTEIRALSRGLSAPDIDNLSLVDVVKRAVEDHAEHSPLRPEISFYGGDMPDLSVSDKLCVFRFLQETLSNTARYAPQSRCSVTCHVRDDCIVIQVKDDGPGFDPLDVTVLRDDGGQGLLGLRDRVESIGGKFQVLSSPGQGTTVEMTLFPNKTSSR